MIVLIIARCRNNRYAPFITEQADALRKLGIEIVFFPVKKNGFFGYLSHLLQFNKAIKEWKPDLIHAHYGLCGLLANMQRRIPVVTTYHGSDINNPRVRPISRLSIWLSSFNIFVSKKCLDIMAPETKYALIPCGINLDDYPVIEKREARRIMGLEQKKKYFIFSGRFDNYVKNAPLAKASVELIEGAELLELKGYTRLQVATIMQAVDALLMTSFSEGSPQVIKEALACGCPIVSVDVGDVRELIYSIDGCYISERKPDSIARCLQSALSFQRKTLGRQVLLRNSLTNESIAIRIREIYNRILV